MDYNMDYKKLRDAEQAPLWQRLEERIGEPYGKEITEAFREFNSLFTDDVLVWLAGLYDADIGGFYFSNSARDNDGFLPDAESTKQAFDFLEGTGLLDHCGKDFSRGLPKRMLDDVSNFVFNLQDSDGYFYHPQWGKNIYVTRRGRDLLWCTHILSRLGRESKYPTILGTEKKNDTTLIPEHLRSEEAFREYLSSLDIRQNSYAIGNELAEQRHQITATGRAAQCIKFLDENQNPENGSWDYKKPSDVDFDEYMSTNGIMKISVLYNHVGAPLNYPEKMAKTIMNVLSSESDARAGVDIYNPWYALINLMNNLKEHATDSALVERIKNSVYEKAPYLIRNSLRRIRAFKRPDGSFGYLKVGSCPTSQGAPVALRDVYEGDVNGTVIATLGIVGFIYSALDLFEYRVPFFTKRDMDRFLTLIENKYDNLRKEEKS
ncbi:MAG: hypothetical protein J6B48_10100 [Clostridia bacterium]|nr:hypothetical protein [Clostridia bacterium]